jgi:two-component system, NarL family, nitrate/nitrite response regulator NarL
MITPQTHPVRIVLIDDHALVRAGLRLLIESQPSLKIVGEAANPADALRIVADVQPDVMLLDLDLGGSSSLDTVPGLLEAVPQGRIILLTGSRDQEEHLRAVRLGAMGVVLKDQAATVLVEAIARVHAGEVWLDNALMARAVTSMQAARPAPPDPEAAKIAALTQRERDVIALICQGLPNREIGKKLYLSESTVRHHLTSIFDKLGVQSRLELVIYAYRQNLASPQD